MRNMSKKTWKLRVWNHMTEIQKLDLLLKRAKVPHTYGRRWPEMDRMEPIPTTVNTLREALQSLEVARNHFEHCDPEFVDAAIFELNAAECRVDAVRRCAE